MVGAGYAVSEPVGNAAVIVKLFRVFLLLPVVLGIGWWLAAGGVRTGAAKVPVPMFAIMFLVLCIVNTAARAMPALAPVYVPVKAVLDVAATWGLLLAIAALGAGTSVAELRYINWRHGAVFFAATATILLAVAVGLRVMGPDPARLARRISGYLCEILRWTAQQRSTVALCRRRNGGGAALLTSSE